MAIDIKVFTVRNQIFVLFEKAVEFHLTVDDTAPMASDAARTWLDKQFLDLECEPLRASGKVLTADKVLVVTQAAGPALLADEKWAAQYASAVYAALGRPMIRVDVPAMAITY